MKGFIEALEEIFGETCRVERYAPSVYRIECGAGRLKLLFYRLGTEDRVVTTENSYLHIDEDHWVSQPKKLLSRLKVRAGRGKKIHARDTVVARIDKKQAMDFQRAHHMQVALPGKFRYGLFLQGELVSVAVFSGGRRMRDRPADYRSFELLRFCHKGELLLVGGLSKLIGQFQRDHHPGDLMTYSDRDWSDGASYERLGFAQRGVTEPQEFWIDRESQARYTARELPDTLKALDPGALRNRNVLKTLGFSHLKNSGSLKLVKTFYQEPIVILGPTASGKTRLAVELARQIGGAIISADSRQVYRGLDIGTGKDLAEYGKVPYFLIDIVDAGERYHVANFLGDAGEALRQIRQLGLVPIICGGTGMYIQGLLQGYPYSDVPTDETLRASLADTSLDELREKLAAAPVPEDFRPDTSTRKRLIRALEIAAWLAVNPDYTPQKPLCPQAKVYGIAPERENRREAISKRLRERLEQGLLDEVRGLLDRGLTPEQLIYYGLEYKYCTLYLTGQLDDDEFPGKLEAEIHRFAKRQMTYFRKMEKDGIRIHWLDGKTSVVSCPEKLLRRTL